MCHLLCALHDCWWSRNNGSDSLEKHAEAFWVGPIYSWDFTFILQPYISKTWLLRIVCYYNYSLIVALKHILKISIMNRFCFQSLPNILMLICSLRKMEEFRHLLDFWCGNYEYFFGFRLYYGNTSYTTFNIELTCYSRLALVWEIQLIIN